MHSVTNIREARIRGVLAVLNRVPNPASLEYLERALADEGPPIVGVFANPFCTVGFLTNFPQFLMNA